MSKEICPYLGLIDDPETAVGYPSSGNHCHCTEPVSAVRLDHQRQFCLQEKHVECKLFCAGEGQPAKQNKDVILRRRKERPTAWKWAWILLIVLAAGGVTAWMVFFRTDGQASISPGAGTGTSLPATGVTTPQPLATNSPVSVSTTTPAKTATVAVQHALEIPIGTQYPMVIHEVKDGESLPLLAKKYNTTEAAIVRINYRLSLPLWSNTVIVIPLNQMEVSRLPYFEPYQIPGDTSLETLARRFSVETSALEMYNLVSAGHVFTIGEWVLIPHTSAATPEE